MKRECAGWGGRGLGVGTAWRLAGLGNFLVQDKGVFVYFHTLCPPIPQSWA